MTSIRSADRPPVLFVPGAFKSHSGIVLTGKIDCELLADGDLRTLCTWIGMTWGNHWAGVYGIPRGGVNLAEMFRSEFLVRTIGDQMLILDDVYTTGESIRDARSALGYDAKAICIFARREIALPNVHALFQANFE